MALIDYAIEADARRQEARALQQYEAAFKALKSFHKYGGGLLKMQAKINLDAVAKLIRFFRVLSYRRIRVGFLSRGKLNKRKRFWAIQGGPPGVDRQPARSPIPSLMASAEFNQLKIDLSYDVRDAALEYFNKAKAGRATGSPTAIRDAIFRKYKDRLAALMRNRRFYTGLTPVKGQHKDRTPLHETGKLVASIRGKLERVK